MIFITRATFEFIENGYGVCLLLNECLSFMVSVDRHGLFFTATFFIIYHTSLEIETEMRI
jgi:hypothetical protein